MRGLGECISGHQYYIRHEVLEVYDKSDDANIYAHVRAWYEEPAYACFDDEETGEDLYEVWQLTGDYTSWEPIDPDAAEVIDWSDYDTAWEPPTPMEVLGAAFQEK